MIKEKKSILAIRLLLIFFQVCFVDVFLYVQAIEAVSVKDMKEWMLISVVSTVYIICFI